MLKMQLAVLLCAVLCITCSSANEASPLSHQGAFRFATAGAPKAGGAPAWAAKMPGWWVPKQFSEVIDVPDVTVPEISIPEIVLIKTKEDLKAALEDTKPKFIAPIFYTWSYFRMYKPSWIFQTKWGSVPVYYYAPPPSGVKLTTLLGTMDMTHRQAALPQQGALPVAPAFGPSRYYGPQPHMH